MARIKRVCESYTAMPWLLSVPEQKPCKFYGLLFQTLVKYSKKNARVNWQEEDFQNARKVVRTSKLSTNAAAVHYKVPRGTLRAYLAENKWSKPKLGKKTVILPQKEKESSKRISRLAQTGCPISLKILRICVFTYCEKNNIPNPFVTKKGMAGHAWIQGFKVS